MKTAYLEDQNHKGHKKLRTKIQKKRDKIKENSKKRKLRKLNRLQFLKKNNYEPELIKKLKNYNL